MITRKCPCCHKKTIKLLKFFETIKPLKRYNWHICSHCGSEVNAWSFDTFLLTLVIVLDIGFGIDIPINILGLTLFYALFDGIISPLWTPLSVVEKTESNDMDFIKK